RRSSHGCTGVRSPQMGDAPSPCPARVWSRCHRKSAHDFTGPKEFLMPTPAAADRPDHRRSRRSLLRTGVLGAGAAAVLAAATGTGASAAAAAQTPADAHAPLENLFTLADLDFDTLFAFGG